MEQPFQAVRQIMQQRVLLPMLATIWLGWVLFSLMQLHQHRHAQQEATQRQVDLLAAMVVVMPDQSLTMPLLLQQQLRRDEPNLRITLKGKWPGQPALPPWYDVDALAAALAPVRDPFTGQTRGYLQLATYDETVWHHYRTLCLWGMAAAALLSGLLYSLLRQLSKRFECGFRRIARQLDGVAVPIQEAAWPALSPFQTLEQRIQQWRETQQSGQQESTQPLAAPAHEVQPTGSLHTPLASMMTHELRTPLNGIMGGLQLLATEHLSRTQQDSYSLIENSAQRLSHLLEQVNLFNQLEYGQLQPHLTMTNAEELLMRLATEYEPRLQQQGRALKLTWGAPIGPVLIDAKRVSQVIQILLDNACTWANKGSVRLHAERLQLADPVFTADVYWRWCITVQDEGPGIATHEQALAFRPFTQLASGVDQHSEGMGLGLAIASRLSQRLGGQLTLKSQRGAGAQFTLNIPLPDVQQALPRLGNAGIVLLGSLPASLQQLMVRVSEWTQRPLWQVKGHMPDDWLTRLSNWQQDQQLTRCLIVLAPMSDETRQWLIDQIRGARLPVAPSLVQLATSVDEQEIQRLQGQGIDHILQPTSQAQTLYQQMISWLG